MFSVKDLNKDEPQYEAPEDVFDRDLLIQNVNLETLSLEDDVTGMPFESIKATMKNVNASGTIKKKILREGTGAVISADALVRIHYAGFFEFNEVPFDSSYLRGKSFEFILGHSGVVPGLDIAVSTMRSNEKSEFILHPSLAFGKLGCPPRIPPNAEVLFIVEVMRWSLGSEAAVARAETNTKGEKDWKDCKAAFKILNHEGICLYNDHKFQESKAKLDKAKRLIENCHLKDDAEEKDFKDCMYKISLNLAMVLNKLHGHASYAPAAIINAKEALQIKPGCEKAELQWGIALMTLGELDRARDHLMISKRKMPNSVQVTDALEKLEMKKKREKEVEGGMWKRVFNPTEESKGAKIKELSPENEAALKLLEEFRSSPQAELILPASVTVTENDLISSLAESLNLQVQIRDKSLRIIKS